MGDRCVAATSLRCCGGTPGDQDDRGTNELSKIESILGTRMSQNLSRDRRLACPVGLVAHFKRCLHGLYHLEGVLQVFPLQLRELGREDVVVGFLAGLDLLGLVFQAQAADELEGILEVGGTPLAQGWRAGRGLQAFHGLDLRQSFGEHVDAGHVDDGHQSRVLQVQGVIVLAVVHQHEIAEEAQGWPVAQGVAGHVAEEQLVLRSLRQHPAADQASLRSRERFWDIRVPKIDSIFDNSLVPRPSWSPGVPPQHRKLVAATHRSPI